MAYSRLRESAGVLATQLVGAAAFFGLWEMVVAGGWAGEAKFGQPSRIAAYFWAGLVDGTLLHHLGVTLFEELASFALGTLLGTAIGLGLWWSPLLSRVLEPFAGGQYYALLWAERRLFRWMRQDELEFIT